VSEPIGRFCIAFDQPTLYWDCTWTRIDSYPNLVTSYQIDRGRQYELDRTDTGRATVTIADPDGILDPTNPSGPYYGQIEPLLQAALAHWDPTSDQWWTRFRGFIEDYDYVFDPSQRVSRLQITLVDLFEILSAIEMVPGPTGAAVFGDDPATVAPDSVGQIVFANESMQHRIEGVLGDAHIPNHYWVVFTGNVELATSVHSPGESVMDVIAEACDGEWPGVSNCFCDRFGRLAVHGRRAKFFPFETHASADPGTWDWHHWQAGDGFAIEHGSGIAQLREFAFNRGLSKVINQALATPAYKLNTDGTLQIAVEDEDIQGNVVIDTTSQDQYGIRAWSAQNLTTLRGTLDDSDSITETKRFATFYTTNYSQPRNRITNIAFRTMNPNQPHAGACWALMSQVDISDLIDITVNSPGDSDGGFFDESYFVEGVHEQVNPLNLNYDDITVSLDLSPQAYFNDTSMFPDESGG
jgi:hypothetical protein